MSKEVCQQVQKIAKRRHIQASPAVGVQAAEPRSRGVCQDGQKNHGVHPGLRKAVFHQDGQHDGLKNLRQSTQGLVKQDSIQSFCISMVIDLQNFLTRLDQRFLR